MKKILLIHGWDYANYSKATEEKNAWHNRKGFLDLLSKKYELYYLNLPGFCGEKEPNIKSWNLDNFASYIDNYIKTNNLKIDYLLGYSFGGAVAIRYYTLFKNMNLILISPAIYRNQNNSKKFIKTPKFLNGIRDILRNLYVIYIKKTPEMVYGAKFLRNTYQNIVRENLVDEVNKIDPKKIAIIYGEKDNMVTPNFVYEKLNKNLKEKVFFIKNGGHDIANTNTKDIIDIINRIIL